MTVEELYQSVEGSYASAKKVLMNDKLITRFLGKFLNDSSFANLSAAFDAWDLEGIFQASHAMKGVCANLGLTRMAQLAGEITEDLRPGKERKLTDQELKDRMEELKVLYNKTVAAVKEFIGQ